MSGRPKHSLCPEGQDFVMGARGRLCDVCLLADRRVPATHYETNEKRFVFCTAHALPWDLPLGGAVSAAGGGGAGARPGGAAMSEPVHIFSNGFEFDCWEAKNCDRCVKEPTCDLLAALFTDGLAEGMYQGQVLPETAERLGYTEEYRGVLGWPCKERQAIDEPPAPAAREMERAGAAMLPDFDAGAAS